ncbi:MAG: hypothetical protein NC397_08960 [Clostridium sp.]|nr:hypothetical protein [Clostridium sp.]
MFPHDITIYRHCVLNGTDIYNKQVLNGFYWNCKTAQSVKNKGADNAAEVTVISSPQMAQRYGNKWKIQVGDIIIKGKGSNISSLKDLTDVQYYKVYAVEENICGSDVDNIVVKGK